MAPPATALTQNKAICAAARHTAASSAQAAARARLTVAPQLPWRASSSVCRGLTIAFLQALDQKEVEDMMLRAADGESFKEALNRQWGQCCSFVAAAGMLKKLSRGNVLHNAPRWLQEGRGSAQPEANGTDFGLL